MYFCNIQGQTIGMKTNIDQPKSNGFFFFSSSWLVTPVSASATTYYLFIPVSLKGKDKHGHSFQSLVKRKIQPQQQT